MASPHRRPQSQWRCDPRIAHHPSIRRTTQAAPSSSSCVRPKCRSAVKLDAPDPSHELSSNTREASSPMRLPSFSRTSGFASVPPLPVKRHPTGTCRPQRSADPGTTVPDASQTRTERPRTRPRRDGVPSKRPERLQHILTTPGFQQTMQDALAGLAVTQATSPGSECPDWPLPNVWLGTSIELDRYARRRVAELRATPASVRMLSLEPLLGPLSSLDLAGIDWILIGGESGPGARPMDLAWARDLIATARAAGAAVFVKQLGTCWAREHGSRGKGTGWDDWPEDLQLREFPAPQRRG